MAKHKCCCRLKNEKVVNLVPKLFFLSRPDPGLSPALSSVLRPPPSTAVVFRSTFRPIIRLISTQLTHPEAVSIKLKARWRTQCYAAEITVDNSLFPTVRYTNSNTERWNMWEWSARLRVIASKS